jgi:hypothetical protein
MNGDASRPHTHGNMRKTKADDSNTTYKAQTVEAYAKISSTTHIIDEPYETLYTSKIQL